MLKLLRIGGFCVFFSVLLPAATFALPPDSFSVQINLKISGAVDLRDWEKPFSFSQALLHDTTAAILKTESQKYKMVTETDSAVQYVKIRHLLLGKDWLQPVVFSRDEYAQFRLRQDLIKQFREESIKVLKKQETQAGGEALTIEIPFKIKSKTFNKIFGGDRVRLRISGNINIQGGFRREDRSQVATVSGQETDYSFHIDQTQRFKITGEVGDKVSVQVDQDSERMFEFENSLKLTYTGYEDEIIQKIEAGNIGLQLAGTKLATFSGQNKGLFGLKTELKFGAFSLTGIASLEKGEKNKLTITGGAQETSVDIPVNNPSTGRYFFLGSIYRENFNQFNTSMEHWAVEDAQQIDANNFYVYKKNTQFGIGGTQPANQITAFAVYHPSYELDPSFYTLERIEELDSLGMLGDKNIEEGQFVELNASQYYLDPQLGYIRLNTPLQSDDILAIAYATKNGTVYGDLMPQQGETAVLKLIRPENPYYTDDTWPLEWRNVYNLGGANVEKEGFSLSITYNPGGTTEQETWTLPDGTQQTFLTLFGFDTKSETGQDQPDGKIDDNPAFINYSYGEIIFPDLRPFDPQDGYYISDGLTTEHAPYWGDPDEYPDSLRYPLIYDPTEQIITTDFRIKAQFKSVKATYELGFNVLEGSEEVYLGGRKLQKGTDYVIDYYSGTLTILNQGALSPSANLEIVYESGELFQLDKKTLLGIRGEYRLWDQSFIGVTALYLNEKPLQERVRVGNEPLRNFLWDINSSLVFKPKFLTKAVDFLPLVETEAPSELRIEMEYAQVHPNPNSLNNSATGDPNGVAYVDDFESIKRTTPLGIMRRQWTIASYPFGEPEGKRRGTFVWFNPYDQVPIQEIWPNRPTNANVAQRTHVLTFYFSPVEPGPEYPMTKEDELESSWGGVMRSLSTGYHNQENSKYIEVLLKVRKYGSNLANIPGKLHIDLGQLDEDVIDNDLLDTEDQPFPNLPYGDGFCDPDEDVGLDGRAGSDTTDWWDIDGDGERDWEGPYEPLSRDDWYYSPSNPYDVWKINGTEGNYNDEGGRYPDTEDLDRDNFLDQSNNFFRYTIDLSEVIPAASYGLNPGGSWHPSPQYLVTAPNDDDWKMYRIPLEDGVPFGEPNFTQIQYARVWLDGFSDPDTIEVSIATLEIVGNEWEAATLLDTLTGISYEPLSVEVINTYDDPSYTPPPGVAGERDPITDIISQEQSLVLRVSNLADSTVGLAVRRLYQPVDFLEYRKLKMFVHGGGVSSDSNIVNFNDEDREIWMFFRFGSDTTNNYYEYRQRVYADWDTRNEIIIDLDQLPQLKRPDLPDTITVDGEDLLLVVGNPSISQVKQFTVGILPIGWDISEKENIEIWLDELRVSDVKRDIGRAVRASANLTLADLATLNVSVDAKNGDFHNVNTRVGTRQNSISGSATGSLRMDKFLNPEWGLSIPVNGNYSQSESVPYYFPNSDILVDDSNQAQVDSVKTYSQSYGAGVDVSKTSQSTSPWLKYTVDRLSCGYDYSYRESSNPTTLKSLTETYGADAAYDLTFGRPSIAFLTWLRGVPLLKKYADARIYYLITKLNMSISGTESITKTRYRAGNSMSSHTFFLTKTLSSGLRPFENLTFDVTRTHRSDLLMDPNNPKGVEDIFQGDLGWDRDMDVNQTVTSSYTPSLVSWLDTDFRYNTTYHWSWGNGYVPSGQTINNNNTITASGTLKLTQIFTKPVRPVSAEPTSGGPDATTGQPDEPKPEAGSPESEAGEPSQLPSGADSTQIEEGGAEGGEPDEGAAEDTTRILPTIAKPTKQSAIQDFWYVLRYTVSRLRDLRIDYTQQKNWSDPLVDGQAGIGYQLGLYSNDYSQIPNAASYTGYSTRTRTDDYKFKSGLDFTRNLKMSLSYSYSWNRNESSSVNGSFSQSRLYFFKTGGDSVDVFELPIPDWSLTWSGLEKLPMFQNVAKTVSLENTYTGSKSSNWTESRDNIKQHDYNRSFNPLLGVNITWNKGISSSLRYNWTETGTVTKFPTASKSRTQQKNLQVSASYTMKTGFKIPIPVWPFKNKRFKNSTTLAMTFNYSTSRTENESDGQFYETNFTNTWSIKPSLDYTFSNTVTGGMHFEYGANKSKTIDSNYQEFGIRVNITIRG